MTYRKLDIDKKKPKLFKKMTSLISNELANILEDLGKEYDDVELSKTNLFNENKVKVVELKAPDYSFEELSLSADRCKLLFDCLELDDCID